MKILTDYNIDEFLKQRDKLLFVIFHSPQCGACGELLVDVFGKIDKDFNGRIEMGKCNIMENSFYMRYNVNLLPVVLVFFNEHLDHRIAGLHSKEYWIKKIEEFLKERKLK